ncbi:MAG: ABC transporter ATP-binding protein, partial [Candidatus Neomarinimicrobiota bacterium]
MIRARGLGKAVGDRWLFRQLQFHWTAGDRVGIVGPNGSGKSTFFRLLLGRDSPTEGELHRRTDLVMGYLPQELPAAGKGTVLEEVLAAAPDLLELEQTLDQISLALRRSPGDESLLKQWGEIQSRLDARQSWNREEEARSMLSSLGFSEEQVTMPYASLSGGWRMRVRLAGLLVQKPEALLLDEPTNHLDLDGVLWLERFLASWQGLLLLVSHDRALLDRIATQILWFAPEGALLRKGNFSRVEEHRRQIRDHQLAAWKHQQKQRLATERFIDRFRAKNTKASQVQSRIRYLDRLEPIAEPEGDPDEPRIRIPAPSRGPLRLIRLEGAGKTFGERVIYSRVDFTLERGEKIALTGPNGSGKSTLLKLLAGKENLTSGDRRVGPD